MHRVVLTLPAAVIAAGILLTPSAIADPAAATDLGTLPGDTNSYANSLNDDGVLVGGSFTTSPSLREHAVRWSLDGTKTALPALPGDGQGGANGINSSGVIVGWSAKAVDQAAPHAVRWNADGTVTPLAEFPNSTSAAFAVNESGQIAGWIWNGTTVTGVRWEMDGTITALAPRVGDAYAMPSAINDDGSVTGDSVALAGDVRELRRADLARSPRAAGPKEHAMRWDADGDVIELDPLSGDDASWAASIATDGTVVGTSVAPDGSTRAVRWAVDGSVTELPRLSPNDASVAVAINDAGVAVGETGHSNDSSQAVSWPADGGATDLGSLSGSKYARPRCLNFGGTVAGSVVLTTGIVKAVRWTP